MANKNADVIIQLGLPQRSFDRLEALAAVTDSSHAEVIGNAIRLYEAAVKEIDAGGKVIIRKADGSEVEAL